MAVNDQVDNEGIENETTYRPDVQDTESYTSVLGENIYRFMDHAYYGTGGFRDGSYLISHSRELFYDARRDLAFYKNYVQPILSAMINPVFNEEVNRDVMVNDTVQTDTIANDFIDDCDNAGTHLQMFTKNALETARLHGSTFVVVDNFTDQPERLEDAQANRIFPYVYLKRAYSLDDYELDRFGNIVWIRFFEREYTVKENGVEYTVKEYSYWDDMEYKLQQRKTKNFEETGELIDIEVRQHGLGVVPVIDLSVVQRIDRRVLDVDPPLYDIAKINHTIFNKDSEIRDQERAQGFSLFYVQSDKTGNFSIGTHVVAYLPMDTNIPPGFASPNPAILDGLVSNGEKLRDDLFRIAGQKGVVGVERAKSGLALEWEFTAQEAVLKETATIAEMLEHKIMDLFQMYTSFEFEYDVDYQHDFKPKNDKEELERIELALMQDLPARAALLLKKRAFLLTSKNLDEDKVQTVVDEFDELLTGPMESIPEHQPADGVAPDEV